MKANKLLSLLLALTMVFALLAGCSSGGSQATPTPAATTPAQETTPAEETGEPGEGVSDVAVDEWVIPVLSARTGAVSHVGEPAVWAAEYAAKVINDAGGIRGVPVKIEAYDTEFTAEVGAQIASRLVDDTLFMVGCMAAPVSLAIGQLISDAQLPNVGSYSYPQIRADYAPYAYGYMSDSEAGDLAACVEWCEEYGYEKIVLFYTPSDTSQAATRALFESELQANYGIEVVSYVEIETGTLDCGPAAVQALGTDADAFFLCLRHDEAGKVINELRTRGVDSGEKMCVSFAAFGSTLLDICGDNAEGLYIWNKLDSNYQGAEWQALVAEYEKKFNDVPSVPPVPGFYNALIAFKQCVEELSITGDPGKLQEERELIANWFYNSPDIEGIQGTFQWVDGQMMTGTIMYQVQDGAFVAIG